MAKVAVEQSFSGATTPITAYDSTKINLGSMMVQGTDSDKVKWVGPEPCRLLRGADTPFNTNYVGAQIWDWSTTQKWVFIADGSGASATKKVCMFQFTKGSTVPPTCVGSLTVTFPPNTNHTVTAQNVYVYTYSSGTVSVSGTAVTGTSTQWVASGQAVGARIGFGSTDPTQITTWYDISAIGSDTTITLANTAGSIGGGSSYVIEEIRVYITTTNATTTNGGLFVVKGLNPRAFSDPAVTIPAATTTDNIRAVYWLADASTVTNINAMGLAILSQVSNTVHYAYVTDGTSGAVLKFYKYNLRAALSLTAGKDTANATQFSTAAVTLTGSFLVAKCGAVYAVANHGPGKGVGCIYVSSQSRLYMVVESTLTSGLAPSPSILMEIPPGNTGLWTLPNFDSLSYSSLLDRFVAGCNSAGSGGYTLQWLTGVPFDTIFGSCGRQVYNAGSTYDSAGCPPSAILPGSIAAHVVGTSLPVQPNTDSGYVLIVDNGGQVIYMLPAAAHWKYAATTSQRIITPAISTPNCLKYYSVYIQDAINIGDSEVGTSPEPFRVYYRTNGITGNTGAWTLLKSTLDLSGVAASSSIQFMFEFKVLGRSGLLNYIYDLAVVYETITDLPSQFAWSVNNASLTNGTVAFTQTSQFGTSVPGLTIDYYNATTGVLLLEQKSTGTTNGTFQYYSSGWVNGLGPDTIGTQRRFVPATALPASTNVLYRIKLT